MHPPAQRRAIFDGKTSAASLTARLHRPTAAALADKVAARREGSRLGDARRRGRARVARCAAPRARGVTPVIR